MDWITERLEKGEFTSLTHEFLKEVKDFLKK